MPLAAVRRRSRRVALCVALAATGLMWIAPLPGLVLWFLLVLWALITAPGAAVTLSWAGFWLYLGSLDLLGIETRSRWTATWYILVAGVIAALAWARRHRMVERLRSSSSLERLWLAGSILLGVDFVLGAALLGGSSLSHKLLAVFLVSTVPATIAAAGLDRLELDQARMALIVLAVAFAIIDLLAMRHGNSSTSRFSPIASLDPISASLVTSLGCVATLTLRQPRCHYGKTAVAATCFLLATAAQLNSTRGPLLALGVGILAVLATRRRAVLLAVAAALAGIALGNTLEAKLFERPSSIGSLVNVHSPSTPSPPAQTPSSISSIHIRKEWIRSALRQFPDRPIFGHGIGVLVDKTPEAARMGVTGQLIYPHNDLVEAAYSLGTVGIALFSVFTVIPLAVLWRHRRRLEDPVSNFCFVIFAFALVESNFSGEIGTDALLWSSSCLVVLTLRHPLPAMETP